MLSKTPYVLGEVCMSPNQNLIINKPSKTEKEGRMGPFFLDLTDICESIEKNRTQNSLSQYKIGTSPKKITILLYKNHHSKKRVYIYT